MNPSTEWPPAFEIHPARVKKPGSRIHELSTGACVGYGCTFVAHKPTRAALVPIGMAMAFIVPCPTKSFCPLVGGRRAPIIGG